MTILDTVAERLDHAASTATAISQLAEPLSLADAYAVQAASISRRVGRGERRIGVKMGFTSRAKREQMGVGDVIWGRLTEAMLVEEGGELALDRFIHPRIEPEIAFLLKAPLGPRVSGAEALNAVAAIAPALEIIDSRYRDFRFSLTDVVADNASSSALVVGAWSCPTNAFANLGMVMSRDGRAVEIGSSAAIMGHPLRALVAAARVSAEGGEPLRAGDLVLAGAATAAMPLGPGQYVSLEIDRIGGCALVVGPGGTR